MCPHTTSRSLALALLLASATVRAEPPVTLADATGDELAAALHPAAKRPLVVHVWASWCVPCVAEWPALAGELRDFAKRPLDVLVVSIDDAADRSKAEKVLGKVGALPGKMLLVPPGAAVPAIRAIDPSWDGSIPTTYVIDGDGAIAVAQRGGTRFDTLEEGVDRVAPVSPRAGKAGRTVRSKERKE